MVIIGGHDIRNSEKVYIIAELSANHHQNYSEAERLIYAAKEAGADAVKLQTYTPDTLTINCDNEHFRTKKGSLWEGKTLYQLYGEAYTPWEWQPHLKELAEKNELGFLSSPFDYSAVDFLEGIDIQIYKIASFEIVDLPLISRIAETCKPIIMSTGMATLAEIDEAVQTIKSKGNNQIVLLKCTSSYPAPPEDANLRTIQHLSEAFSLPVGLSDHTVGIAVPVAAVALGARVIEKHFTLDRNIPGPDSKFSLEPSEFKSMVDAIRTAELSLGEIKYGVTDHQTAGFTSRRSLFAVKDIAKGEMFTKDNVRSIRPGYGLHTRYLGIIIERKAANHIKCGTPITWGNIGSIS